MSRTADHKIKFEASAPQCPVCIHYKSDKTMKQECPKFKLIPTKYKLNPKRCPYFDANQSKHAERTGKF